MSHHSFGQSTTRGLQLTVRLYPWSALWIMFAIALILIAQGAWQALVAISGLILVVVWHTIHRDHEEHPKTRRGSK